MLIRMKKPYAALCLFVALLAGYPLLAALKNELVPGDGHVSLLGSIGWQLFGRASSGSVLDASPVMSTVTFATRTYTPLAFREETERRIVATLVVIVAIVYVFVIPLEIVMHERGNQAVVAKPPPATQTP